MHDIMRSTNKRGRFPAKYKEFNMNMTPTPAPYIRNFEQLGFGMFVHFGLYSQLGKGEWTYSIHKRTAEEYKPLRETFRVGSMRDIVETAKSAGCKYITLTTRHHEGFSLYDTKGLSDFDVMHSPTGRDLIREFTEECRKEDIVPFFYHTTLDWLHEDFNENFDRYLDYLYESVKILCTEYGKIGGLWFDGNWSKKDADWKEDRLYKMIHHYQPEAMIINNTGLSHRGEFGEPEIDAVTYERGMPEPMDQSGREKYVAAEMCETLCDHWGLADDINFKPVKQLIRELCECRKVGANFLLNIGPNADGSVPLMQKATMQCIGRWMETYGKAIYNGRPFIYYPDRREFLMRDAFDPSVAYLFVFNLNQSGGDANVTLNLTEDGMTSLKNIPYPVESAKWMDSGRDVVFRQSGDEFFFKPTGFRYGTSLCVRVAEIKFKEI